MSLATKTTSTPSSMTTPTMAMVVIAVSLGVALIFAVGITVVVLRVRSVERFRRRTIWPPTPLLSATITSASMIEPLFKPSAAASRDTVGYVQLLREQHPRSCCSHNRCRRLCVCAREASACVCHYRHCGIETCSGACCGCGITSCRNLQLSSPGASSGDKSVSTSFGRVATDHHIPSRSSTSIGNYSSRYSGGGGCHPPRQCNSSGSEETRLAISSLPHRVDQSGDVAVLLPDETTKSVTLVGNELWLNHLHNNRRWTSYFVDCYRCSYVLVGL